MRKLIPLLFIASLSFAQTVSTIQPVPTTATPNQGRVKWNFNDSLLAKGIDSLRASRVGVNVNTWGIYGDGVSNNDITFAALISFPCIV